MNASSDEKTLLRGYLLAALPEAERLELAARYFADDELFERLSSAEADLIDDYVAGELAPEERQLFERSLETFPGRADRVAFARALQRVPPEKSELAVEEPVRTRLAVWYWPAAAAILLAAVAGVWVARRSAEHQDALRELRSERDRLAQRERQLTAELQELRKLLDASSRAETPEDDETKPPANVVARTLTFLLTAGLPREAGAPNRVRIPPSTPRIRLDLSIEPDPAARYRVAVQRPDGSEVLRREAVRPTRISSGFALPLELAAADLPDGDYVALVEDVRTGPPEPVAEFFFRVIR